MPRTLCSDLVYYREPESLAVCVMCVCEFDAGLARVRGQCVVHGLVMSCPLSVLKYYLKFVVFGGLEFERPDRVRDVTRVARRQQLAAKPKARAHRLGIAGTALNQTFASQPVSTALIGRFARFHAFPTVLMVLGLT